MRKNATKLAAVALSLALTITSVNVAADGASAASKKTKLNMTKKTLYVGSGAKASQKTTTVKLMVKGKKTLKGVKFTSTKKAVATVSSKGVVKAKKAGKTTIKVTYKKKTYKCVITVKTKKAAATEAPATEAPATEAPATEAPATEAPVTLPAMTELKAVSAAKLQATFDAEVPADATIEVTKGSSKIDGKATIDGKTVTFEATANLTAGAYTLTATLGEAKVSKDVDVKDSYVAEIKILNDVALTGKAAENKPEASAAYIYYDVLNQYGESIRTSENIEWTTAPNDKVVDKSLGKITVKKDDGFTFGSQIYVTGVHVKSGQSYSGSVSVGMAQSVNSVEFAGFLSTEDKTKKLDNLPANFKKDNYYLLYKTADQNGNALDVNDEEFTHKNITFICDSPMVLDINTKDNKVFTVDGVEYAAVAVNPGLYTDKGGEVNITAISNKTGVKTTKNIVIGAAGVLKSLELTSPAGIVADGDSDVKIPYTAKDTDGNVVTNYETIVRSSNSLSLSASDDTELVVKEENDGTAGIYWYDAAKYNPEVAASYNSSDVCNDVSRNISLTTVVVGGESSNMMLEVADIRRPSAIKSVKLNDDNNDTIVNGASATLKISDVEGGEAFVYLDQYGAELSAKKADAFFANAKTNKFGKSSDAGLYAVRVKVVGESHLGLTTKEKEYVHGEPIEVSANADEIAVDNVKYSIVKKNAQDKYDDVSKVKTVSYTIVPVSSVKNYAIADLAGVQEIQTDNSGKMNGATINGKMEVPVTGLLPVMDAGETDCRKYKVKGTYEGKTVTLPTTAYEVSTKSAFKATLDAITNVTAGALTWGDLYDFNAYNNPRKKATLDFVVNVKKTATEVEPISKSVEVSDEEAKVAGIKFVYNYNDGIEDVVATPSMTNILSFAVCGKAQSGTLNVYAVDQYGRYINVNDQITFTVSDIVENSGAFAHKKDNFEVNKNATTLANVTGAELGDTFKLTAKVAGYSDVIKVTVGADSYAKVSSVESNTKDKDLCIALGLVEDKK